MIPNMEPCDDMEENKMNQPTGKEDSAPEFIPPVNVTDVKFIELAKKMKNLSQETLNMIKRDLEPSDRKYEEWKDKTEQPEAEVKVMKVDTKVASPEQLLTWIKKVLWFPTTPEQ